MVPNILISESSNLIYVYLHLAAEESYHMGGVQLYDDILWGHWENWCSSVHDSNSDTWQVHLWKLGNHADAK